MLNFEREFSGDSVKSMVSSQAAKESTEQRQRDVFESHRHRTFSLAFYMTGNEIEAEEILANTFVKAFQTNEQPDAFGIDTALIDELSERFSLLHEEPAAMASQGLTLGCRNVRRSDLEAAVQNLPANERLGFLLRDVEGYPPEAIAKLLQIPEAKVNRWICSARIRLRQQLAGLSHSTMEAA